VRLRSVRVVTEAFETVETADVRYPVGIEIGFEVLAAGDPFVPGIALINDQGQAVFGAMDTDPAWRTPKPPGRYTSVAWIPPNLLNEGMTIVTVALGTHSPGGRMIRQAQAHEVVAFQVIDPGEGGTARGDYAGIWSGPVRPLLRWGLSRETPA
jgi:lipopolysaccharide transport system ATP-binding protein